MQRKDLFRNKAWKYLFHSSQFYLDPGLNYRIFLHDPKFYHILTSNGIFPRIFLQYKEEWSNLIGRNLSRHCVLIG